MIRVSGPRSKDAVRTLCGVLPADRVMHLAAIRDREGELLDRGLVVVFSAPASFTGEDCCELHIHGGRASVAAVMQALGELPDLRQAEAGEFTKRAFVNGKMDLTGAEALGDLIAADTEMQRRFALANAGGRQHTLYRSWRERLLHGRAMIEAELDFSDEGDVPGSVADAVWADLSELAKAMRRHLDGVRTGEILREGFRVVILGAPNAGKSSLINCLAQRDVAIVSDEPGTTRDLVEVVLDLDGVRVVVTDTAGLREDAGKVESIGIARALAKSEDSDLVVVLEDLNNPVAVRVPAGPAVVRVGSKADLATSSGSRNPYDVMVSAVTGEGVGSLVSVLRDAALKEIGGWSTSVIPSHLRQVELLRSASGHLELALGAAQALELRAEALRLAADEIGRIVGAIGTEDVLGAIFSRFCIGK